MPDTGDRSPDAGHRMPVSGGRTGLRNFVVSLVVSFVDKAYDKAYDKDVIDFSYHDPSDVASEALLNL